MTPCTPWLPADTSTCSFMTRCGLLLQRANFSWWQLGWITWEARRRHDNWEENYFSLMKYITNCSHAAQSVAHTFNLGGQLRGHYTSPHIALQEVFPLEAPLIRPCSNKTQVIIGNMRKPSLVLNFFYFTELYRFSLGFWSSRLLADAALIAYNATILEQL